PVRPVRTPGKGARRPGQSAVPKASATIVQQSVIARKRGQRRNSVAGIRRALLADEPAADDVGSVPAWRGRSIYYRGSDPRRIVETASQQLSEGVESRHRVVGP